MREQIRLDIHDPEYQAAFVGIFWPSRAWADSTPTQAPALSTTDALESTATGRGEYELEESSAGANLQRPEEGDDQLLLESVAWAGVDRSAAHSTVGDAAMLRARFIDDYRIAFQHDEQRSTYEEDFGRLFDMLSRALPPSEADIDSFVQTLWRYAVDDPHADSTEHGNVISRPEQMKQTVQNEWGASDLEGLNIVDGLLTVFRVFTFWTMKARASVVGHTGVAPFLRDLRNLRREVGRRIRVHLYGHSFGAKLISSAVYSCQDAPADEVPVADTLVLIQGAFSRYSFSSSVLGSPGQAGRYAPVIDRRLLSNPIVATYSMYDRANVALYPMGMRLNPFSPVYEAADRFGSIGASGACDLDPAFSRTITLQPEGQSQALDDLSNVRCLNVDAHNIIKDTVREPLEGAHGDINHAELFHLALAVSQG